MMEHITLILVALAVSLAAYLVWADEVETFSRLVLTTEGQTSHQIELRKEIASHMSFYGSAISAILGVGHGLTAVLITLAWFLVLVRYSVSLTERLEELSEAESKAGHRRMAGTMRSIVKDEIANAAKGRIRGH